MPTLRFVDAPRGLFSSPERCVTVESLLDVLEESQKDIEQRESREGVILSASSCIELLKCEIAFAAVKVRMK